MTGRKRQAMETKQANKMGCAQAPSIKGAKNEGKSNYVVENKDRKNITFQP
jgi:hypothetical protein